MNSCQAIRIRRRSDNPFFIEGTNLSLFDDASPSLPYIEDHHDNNTERDEDHCYADYAVGNEIDHLSYPCPAPTCDESFLSPFQCETHYNNTHVNECSECGMNSGNSFLLALHIQECHDPFFVLSVERRKQKLRCPVEACAVSFFATGERDSHLRDVHDYPRWFRFPAKVDFVALEEKRREMRDWTLKRNKSGTTKMSEDVAAKEETSDIPQSKQKTAPVSKEEKKNIRRERQKVKRSRTPCSFFLSQTGCYRGSKCMFSHCDASATNDPKCHVTNKYMDHKGRESDFKNNAESRKEERTLESDDGVIDSMDVDMDDLVKGIRRKMRVSIPEKISFGRR